MKQIAGIFLCSSGFGLKGLWLNPFRLYNRLEEVKQKKESQSRQESYAKNREKARDFQKVRCVSGTSKKHTTHDAQDLDESHEY